MKPDHPHVADLLTFLRFASVSADAAYTPQVQACADWVEKKLSDAGLVAEQWKTAGHPVVVGRNAHKPGRPTVLIYGHYDVQPADPLELWTSAPFEPTIRDGIVTARGATDNKGQILAHILGVGETMREKGDLPVNVIFLVEGEEETGSPSLAPVLRANREKLKCDVIVISDGSMLQKGQPTLTYATRGLCGLQMKVTGPARDLHSGLFGGAVLNPVTVAARLVASLHDSRFHVAIPGFYEKVRPVADWERQSWKKLRAYEKEMVALSGAPELNGEEGYTTLERLWARPTAEVNGFYGGYQGPGNKTVLPSYAMVKMTFRLVPDQDPDEIAALAEKHLREQAPKGVSLEFERRHGGGGKPYLCEPSSGYAKAAIAALQETFSGKEPLLVRCGASIPIVSDFKEILGVDTLFIDLGDPDCNMHSPNETFPLENFEKGIALNKALLPRLAAGV
jgi:acetylornithine deacetylase/succinyl-diaminopimelate desuccinylase-like protein